MNDILSQDEVDLLLKAVETGDVDTEAPNEVNGLRSYDFNSQERIIRGSMPGLDIANDRFARFFRNSMSNFIMKFIDVSVQGMELMKFSEFMKIIPFPSSINIFKIDNPLKGYALLILEAPLVFTLVEFFFGSKSASWYKSEGRAFTTIEQQVIKKVVLTALKDLAAAWESMVPINPEYVASEMNPHFITIVTPSEIVIKIEIHVEIEDFTGKLFICIPYSLIEPVRERLYSGIQSEMSSGDHRWVKRLEEILMDSYVDVTAEVGTFELTLEELLSLEVGSVINLYKPLDEEVVVKVGDVPKLKGTSGYSRGSQAVKITKIYR